MHYEKAYKFNILQIKLLFMKRLYLVLNMIKLTTILKDPISDQ